MDLAERLVLASEVERLCKENKTFDEVLAYLRKRGCSKLGSIAVLSSLVGLRDAKGIVHQSPVWHDVKERDDQFHEMLCAELHKISSTPPPSDKEI